MRQRRVEGGGRGGGKAREREAKARARALVPARVRVGKKAEKTQLCVYIIACI